VSTVVAASVPIPAQLPPATASAIHGRQLRTSVHRQGAMCQANRVIATLHQAAARQANDVLDAA